MSALTAVLVLLKRFILSTLGLLRRGLCCRRILRRNSGAPLLPTTISKADMAVMSGGSPAYQPTEAPSRPHLPQFSQQQQQHQSHLQSRQSSLPPPASSTEAAKVPLSTEQAEEEEDFFRDMAPQLKRQKKVLLEQSESRSSGHLQQSKFLVDASATIWPSRELGDLQDLQDCEEAASAWDEEALDVRQAIREARDMERRRRQEQRHVRDHKSTLASFTPP